MNDSTIRLSADTSALTDSLSKIADAEQENSRKEINNIEIPSAVWRVSSSNLSHSYTNPFKLMTITARAFPFRIIFIQILYNHLSATVDYIPQNGLRCWYLGQMPIIFDSKVLSIFLILGTNRQ